MITAYEGQRSAHLGSPLCGAVRYRRPIASCTTFHMWRGKAGTGGDSKGWRRSGGRSHLLSGVLVEEKSAHQSGHGEGWHQQLHMIGRGLARARARAWAWARTTGARALPTARPAGSGRIGIASTATGSAAAGRRQDRQASRLDGSAEDRAWRCRFFLEACLLGFAAMTRPMTCELAGVTHEGEKHGEGKVGEQIGSMGEARES